MYETLGRQVNGPEGWWGVLGRGAVLSCCLLYKHENVSVGGRGPLRYLWAGLVLPWYVNPLPRGSPPQLWFETLSSVVVCIVPVPTTHLPFSFFFYTHPPPWGCDMVPPLDCSACLQMGPASPPSPYSQPPHPTPKSSSRCVNHLPYNMYQMVRSTNKRE